MTQNASTDLFAQNIFTKFLIAKVDWCIYASIAEPIIGSDCCLSAYRELGNWEKIPVKFGSNYCNPFENASCKMAAIMSDVNVLMISLTWVSALAK